MPERFKVEFGGREYTVQRGATPASAAEGGGAPVGRESWYVTLGPKAVTSLKAVPGESEAALRARIRGWLDANPKMPDDEDFVLGGG
jgi:hypothetical protein